MDVELILTPEAGDDLSQAYDWYESCRVGLGEEFLSCVDAAFQTILRQPDSFAVVKGGYRRFLVRRFPYQVFYESVPTAVTVYGVLHTSRDPQIGLDRLK